MLHEEHLYSIALRATPLIGDVNFMRLVEITGSAKETWHLSKKLLKEIPDCTIRNGLHRFFEITLNCTVIKEVMQDVLAKGRDIELRIMFVLLKIKAN